ncbi:bifunctional DNA primase/polymerase [Nesterenkonia sp. CL21]|uniref:bifunctional DNA primase/polymerase n=1 Tax=Nesterenkonia sp. CL21 TaxID=3064894 RepID=UPI00287A5248|nr:bifunctional DNA primase/polymerase [Nesterenkonia sp. CL21]MDS2171838.1 bifunctional DNA primase/polymerase [Nesterenkonia sp. CL21]
MASRSALIDVLAHLGEEAPLPVAARALAQAGVPVFPCAPSGKSPLIRDGRGFHDATADLGRVESWWRQAPAANIGVPTGRASGVSVVDVDVHGVDGFTAFRRARRAGLVSGWEAMVRSPTGGLHVYYPSAEREQASWQAGKAGVDFRGDRGYIVIPPSRREIDGETRLYRVASLSPAPTGPVDAQGLRNLLAPPPPPRPPRPVSDAVGSEDARRMASWLSRQDTDRNLKLFWVSCRLAEGDLPLADALDALVTVAQPDFGEREITRTVHSAYRTVATGPTLTRTGERSGGGFVELDAQTPAPTGRGLG